MKNRVKITTFERFLDLLYPCYCLGCGRSGNILCKRCFIYNSLINPPIFNFKDKDFTGVFVCGMREGIIRKMVLDFKYRSMRKYGKSLARMVYFTICKCGDFDFVIVPLPTVRKHIRARGFDHIGVLAEELSKISGWKVENILIRNKNTVQVGKDEATRKVQAKTAYRISDEVKIDPEVNYLLLDDIWTTGASMRSAAEVLRKNGAKNIFAAVIAKNGDRW